MNLTASQLVLLQRVADRDPKFGNQNERDSAEHARLDAELKGLRELERLGLVTLKPQRESMTGQNQWAHLAPLITQAGRDVLAEQGSR